MLVIQRRPTITLIKHQASVITHLHLLDPPLHPRTPPSLQPLTVLLPLYLSSSPASSTSFGMATTSTGKECLSRTSSPPLALCLHNPDYSLPVMALSFMLWNARSLLRKTQELLTYLGDTLPSVVGICETWLPPHLSLSFPGYNIIRKDRGQGRGGGVLLAIHDSLVSSPLPIPQSQDGRLHVVAAKVGLGGGWLTVAVCYNPGGAAGYREFMRYFSTLQPPVLIMGDFNAHHTCWEPDLPPHHHNTSGNTLFQALLDLTHVSLLSPPGLATRFHPHTGAASVLDLFLGDPTFKDSTFRTGPYMGSDHLPPTTATTIAGVLSEAGTAAFPLITRRRPRRPGKPWWDAACAQAVQDRRQAWNQWRRTPTIQAGRAYRRLDAICAKTILKAKRNAWDLHCSTLSFRSSPKSTMSFLRSMEGKLVSQNIPFSDDDSTPLADPEKQKSSLPSLAQPFKPHELSSALATLKPGKAPGLDKVPYDFIRHLTPPLRACLLQLYNSSWQSGQFPSTWKPAILIPIHKPGKDPTLPSAYRPISLLSCIGKLLERLVNTRLTWWLEANNKLAEEQCGFRPHRSTLDVLGQIEYHICDTYRQRQVMTALFLDLEGAFDSAPHEGILYKLALMGITGTTLAWVHDFLTGRSFQVAVGASLSPSQGIHRGVPQGSILSPLLFNVLLSDLQVPTHSHLLLYADDITIVSRAPTLSEAQDRLQEAATAVASNSTYRPYSTSHTLLGLRLDGPRLSWVNHISYEYLRTSYSKRLDVMKRIAGIRWGASRDLLLHYYKITIRAKMQYSSCFYGSAAYSNLLKLDPIQNAALRISMGAMRSSPVVSLQAESGIPPLSTHRRMTLCQQYYRILGLPASHPLSTLHSNSGVDQQAPVWLPAARQPLIVRALLSLTILHLPPPPPQPVNPYSPFPSWLDVTHNFGLPPKPSVSGLAAANFQQLDRSIYHHHLKIYTDGSRDASLPSSAAAIYDANTAICKTWRLPEYTDVLTTELFALLQALIYLRTSHPKSMVVIYTDSRSSLSLLLSRQPSSATTLVHSIQNIFLHLLNTGWDITFQWLHSAKRLLSRLCHSSWDSSLNNALRVTSMGLYHSDSSPQPWVRKQSRILDVALTRLRLGHIDR
ncbi:uncharacterized protein LOC123514153 [Portunus trituberculatus]|uniref:uncharacterized protein LOC123514153 n=1 Tax=Portunus trituberculatus TaxID=210409 RepID=UPI001E1CE651|nr:uncharacterized protein LOC123514153 [Portunus trituberculatus]